MKMLVLGAGLQGSACAYDLLQNDDVTEVRLADLHASHLPDFLGPYSGKRLIPTPIDVRDHEAVGALMREADAFVLSSRYEGFPNVLLEALACRVPIVATDCPGGPREILGDGQFGLLVPCEDPAALAGALRRVSTDISLRERLSALAPVATAEYAVEHVVARWEALLRGGGVPG